MVTTCITIRWAISLMWQLCSPGQREEEQRPQRGLLMEFIQVPDVNIAANDGITIHIHTVCVHRISNFLLSLSKLICFGCMHKGSHYFYLSLQMYGSNMCDMEHGFISRGCIIYVTHKSILIMAEMKNILECTSGTRNPPRIHLSQRFYFIAFTRLYKLNTCFGWAIHKCPGQLSPIASGHRAPPLEKRIKRLPRRRLHGSC